jgi:predicted exporter
MRPKSRSWLWLLLFLPIALGLSRLRFDVEVLNLLPASSPVVEGLKLYQQNFANARELMITLSAPDAEKAEAAARALAVSLRERKDLVVEVTWQPPWLEHPGQSAELVAFLWLNQSPAEFSALTNRLSPGNLSNTLAEARERLATSFSPNDLAWSGYDPFGLMRLPENASAGSASANAGQEFFASADGKFRILSVEAARDLSSYRDCRTWLNEIKRLVQARQTAGDWPGDVSVNYTGRPAFVAEIAGGMERDIAGPSAGTLAVIALLFYISHRSWRPLLWLLALLVVILAGTLALNVVSLGFASILLGLSEDFGIVLYQEARTHPGLSSRQIRRVGAPGIFWSAVTTAGAFLLLNLSGIPGLGQLGTLVAIGVALAAVVMLYAYLPPLMRKRDAARQSSGLAGSDHSSPLIERKPVGARAPSAGEVLSAETPPSSPPTAGEEGESLHAAASAHRAPIESTGRSPRLVWMFTLALVIAGTFLLWAKPARFDQSPDALRPKKSQAYAALNEIKLHLNRWQEPLWLVIRGQDEAEVSRRLAAVEPVLRRAASNQVIASSTLPAALWPRPEHQSANAPAALALANQREALRQAAFASGFTSNSLTLTEDILDVWQRAGTSANVFWPTNENSRWILEKMAARGTNGLLAIGLIHLPPGGAAKWFREVTALGAELSRDGVELSGWEHLGLFGCARGGELDRVLPAHSRSRSHFLWLAFRNGLDVLSSPRSPSADWCCIRDGAHGLVLEHDEPDGAPVVARHGRRF